MAPRLITDQVLDLFVMEGRSPGRHVSDAIYRIMERLHPDRFDGSPIDQVRANLGNAMEKALIWAMAHRYPDRYVQPGELEYRGISGTPDLWDMWGGVNVEPRLPLPPHDWAVTEVKLTWASARRAKDLEDVWWWRYWTQGKAYAKMGGMRKVVIIPTFINGGWEGGRPGTPCGHMWYDEFSDEELDDTWSMIELYSGPRRERRSK